MKDTRPLFSIIVAVYNGAKDLPRCLQSIENQTFANRQLVVMDGGSTDGTVEIINKNKHLIDYWKSESDRGLYHAWNKALEHAQGDWICFLGADDRLLGTDALERMAVPLKTAYPRYRVVYGKVDYVNERGLVLDTKGTPWNHARGNFFSEMTLPHQGVLHHRTLFEEHGCFDESFRIAGDYEFLLRELKTRDALFVPEVRFASMQVGGMSSSPKGAEACLKEFARAREKHGVKPRAAKLFLSRALLAFRKAGSRLFGVNFVDSLEAAARSARRKWFG